MISAYDNNSNVRESDYIRLEIESLHNFLDGMQVGRYDHRTGSRLLIGQRFDILINQPTQWIPSRRINETLQDRFPYRDQFPLL